MGEHKA